MDYAFVELNNKCFSQGTTLNMDQYRIRPLAILTEGLARGVRDEGVWCGSGLFSKLYCLLLSHYLAIAGVTPRESQLGAAGERTIFASIKQKLMLTTVICGGNYRHFHALNKEHI